MGKRKSLALICIKCEYIKVLFNHTALYLVEDLSTVCAGLIINDTIIHLSSSITCVAQPGIRTLILV